MKMLDFPNARQTFEYDCGAKAMHAVLAYYGVNANENEILKIAKTNKRPINFLLLSPIIGYVHYGRFWVIIKLCR